MPAPTGIGTNQPVSQRISFAIPAAGANVLSTNALNLTPQGGRGQGSLKIQISTPAQPTLANAQTLTFEIQDCDTEAGAYAIVPGYGNLAVTGAGGVGAPANGFLLRLHDHVRQFLKLKITSAAGGAVTGNATFETIFQG